MTYTIGPREFTSRQKAQAHASSIRAKYAPGAAVSDPDDDAFLRGLVCRHVNAAQKMGAGIHRFFVDVAPGGWGTCFWLERTDGSRTDFGVPACLESPGKINRRSLRRAIRPGVVRFRESRLGGDSFVSEYSGTEFPASEAHIDHVVPFEALVVEFFSARGIDLDANLLTASVDAQENPVWKDPELIAGFIRFHDAHQLRLVGARENLSDIRVDRR